MPQDLDRFRRLCGQYRWLAVFMVASVGLLLGFANLLAPLVLWARAPTLVSGREVAAAVIWIVPALCYLFGVWSIGAGMGQLAKGRLIQPTLASTLRRVGLSLGFGGVISVFVVTNLLRMIGHANGGYLHFDVAGMTLGMIGGALFLLGRVVDQAGAVQAELDEMI
jgi:hypothetical protein